jgi:hypothetical protein
MKRGCEGKRAGMEFGWLFAVIVGGVILFLAFYFIGTHLLQSRVQQETVAARSLDIILTPFSYVGSFNASSAEIIKLSEKSEVEIDCDSENGLGYNTIVMRGERVKGKTYEELPKYVYDKYLFAEKPLPEAKTLQFLNKPFEMPWRVGDISILWPSETNYCFVGNWESNQWNRIPKELGNVASTGLNISSITFTGSPSDECDVNVCFPGKTGSNCDITVTSNTVTKDKKSLPYSGDALLYAAIFSDAGTYNCNLQRLAKRISLQTEVYGEKAQDMGGCGLQNLKTSVESSSDPTDWIQAANSVKSSCPDLF